MASAQSAAQFGEWGPGGNGRQLLLVAHQDEFGTRLLHVGQEALELEGVEHAGLVHDKNPRYLLSEPLNLRQTHESSRRRIGMRFET